MSCLATKKPIQPIIDIVWSNIHSTHHFIWHLLRHVSFEALSLIVKYKLVSHWVSHQLTVVGVGVGVGVGSFGKYTRLLNSILLSYSVTHTVCARVAKPQPLQVIEELKGHHQVSIHHHRNPHQCHLELFLDIPWAISLYFYFTLDPVCN